LRKAAEGAVRQKGDRLVGSHFVLVPLRFEEAVLRGRPGSRQDDSNPRRLGVRFCRTAAANGVPR
jgi:hypothetical protein